MALLKWIVLEEDPKPDNYIAIMVTDASRILKIQRRACTIFDEDYEAIEHAKALREQYKVKSIRVFYIDGCSETIR